MTEISFQNRAAIESHQLERLRSLIGAIERDNPFWSARLKSTGVDRHIASLEAFATRLSLLSKADLAADQKAHPPYGSNLTHPVDQYVHLHQTSSTTGEPLRWLDTADDWNWLLDGWQTIYEAAGIGAADRMFFPFSFGPFIGFWMAWDAAARMGSLCISGGAMNTATRLRAILANEVTAICCTPTYAIRLGQAAQDEGINTADAAVRCIVVAGEPGGSVPAIRKRIEQLWPTARVFDHHGMTEVGPVTFECPQRPGVLHVNEGMYFCEIIDPATGGIQSTAAGVEGELVITTLGRSGSPVLRYRTGDIVHGETDGICACGRRTMRLIGGIIGRSDDMVVVRGTNLYPSALDAILGAFADIVEYRAEVGTQNGMTELQLRVEPGRHVDDPAALCQRVEQAIRNAWNLRVPVRAAQVGELPRFELKARRWVRLNE